MCYLSCNLVVEKKTMKNDAMFTKMFCLLFKKRASKTQKGLFFTCVIRYCIFLPTGFPPFVWLFLYILCRVN